MSNHRKHPPEFFFTDDFQEIAATGHAPLPDQRMTPFAYLANGKTLGKRDVILVAGAAGGRGTSSPIVDMLEVRGDDKDAMQLGITLCPPLVKDLTGILPLPANSNDINGEMTNQQILALGAPLLYGNCFAVLEWGIGGVNCRAEADFHNGLCINVQASWLRLKGNFEAMQAVGFPVAYALSCFVGPSHAAPSQAQRTQQTADVNVGGPSPVFAIPPFAKTVRVTHDNSPLITDDYSIEFLRSPTGTPVGFTRFLGAAGSSNYFPPMGSEIAIPGNAYFWRINNNNAAGFQNFKATFDLAL